MKRVRSAGAPRDKLLLFIDALISPLILYCSPVIFPSLQKQDFVVLRRHVSLISTLSFILYNQIVTRIVARPMLSTSSAAETFLSSAEHPLPHPLMYYRSNRPLRREFRYAAARTERHRQSIIPFLLRFLIDPSSIRSELIVNFTRN